MTLYPSEHALTIAPSEDGLIHVPIISPATIANILTPRNVSGVIPMSPPFFHEGKVVQICGFSVFAVQYISYGYQQNGDWQQLQQWYPTRPPTYSTGLLHDPINYLAGGNVPLTNPGDPWYVENTMGQNPYRGVFFDYPEDNVLLTDWHILGQEPSGYPGVYPYENPFRPETPVLFDANVVYNGGFFATRLQVSVSATFWCVREIAARPIGLAPILGSLLIMGMMSALWVPPLRRRVKS